MRILYNGLEEPHILNTKLGELVYNKYDHVLYTKDKYQNILKIATGSGGGKDGKDGKDGRDGVSFNIQGTDTYANIIAKPNPKKGDMWIASDRDGHGIVFSGIKWNDVGKIVGPKGDKGDTGLTGTQGKTGTDGKSAYAVWLGQGNTGTIQDFFIALQGQQGVQGVEGPRGTGIHFENSYATKADMVAANPTPDIGDLHLVLDTGNLWVWDNPTPPHDPANAIWSDVGHVQGPVGPAGVQGIQGLPGSDGQPGVDGKDGDPLQLATAQESIDGTVTDKANTPQGANAAYVSRDRGGTFRGVINMPTLSAIKYDSVKKSAIIQFADATQLGLVGYQANVKAVMIYNKKSGASVRVGDTNEVKLVTGGGTGTVTVLGTLNATGSATIASKLTVGSIVTDAYISGTAKPYRMGRYGKYVYMYNLTGACYVDANDTGDINLVPKAGKHAKVKGKNILTGKLTGTTLHLDF